MRTIQTLNTQLGSVDSIAGQPVALSLGDWGGPVIHFIADTSGPPAYREVTVLGPFSLVPDGYAFVAATPAPAGHGPAGSMFYLFARDQA